MSEPDRTYRDFADGRLFRYVVMEKRAGWGADYPADKRNGEWEHQAFNAERESRSPLRLPQAAGSQGFVIPTIA
jgi:hypothetical protein